MQTGLFLNEGSTSDPISVAKVRMGLQGSKCGKVKLSLQQGLCLSMKRRDQVSQHPNRETGQQKHQAARGHHEGENLRGLGPGI